MLHAFDFFYMHYITYQNKIDLSHVITYLHLTFIPLREYRHYTGVTGRRVGLDLFVIKNNFVYTKLNFVITKSFLWNKTMLHRLVLGSLYFVMTKFIKLNFVRQKTIMWYKIENLYYIIIFVNQNSFLLNKIHHCLYNIELWVQNHKSPIRRPVAITISNEKLSHKSWWDNSFAFPKKSVNLFAYKIDFWEKFNFENWILWHKVDWILCH